MPDSRRPRRSGNQNPLSAAEPYILHVPLRRKRFQSPRLCALIAELILLVGFRPSAIESIDLLFSHIDAKRALDGP